MPRRSRIVASVLSLVLGAALWFVFAPPVLGGSTTILSIDGNSMEPGWHAGDLSIVRGSTYEVGDVVAYRSGEIGAILLHRIVSIEDGRYTLKGDNNDFLDVDRPTMGEIVGEEFLRIPAGAKALRAISSPRFFAVTAALSFLFFVIRRRRAGDRSVPKRSMTMTPDLRTRVLAAGAAPAARAAIAGCLAFGFVASGIGVAAARAKPAAGAATAAYTHEGSFAYEARAPRSVYPGGAARTGDAIFLEVSDEAEFSFDYSFASTSTAEISGTIGLEGLITDAAGWSRRFSIAADEPFTGPAATVTGTLDLRMLKRIVARVQAATKVARTIYRVVVLPVVEVGGTLDGSRIDETFDPALPLEYDGLVLRYVADPEAANDPLRPSRAGSTQTAAATHGAATVTLLGATLPARPIAVGAGLLALLAFAAAAALHKSAQRIETLGARERLRTRFADRLVALEHLPERTSVVVATVEGFERLALASDGPIFEHEDRYGISWMLKDGESLYAYREDAGAFTDMELRGFVNLP